MEWFFAVILLALLAKWLLGRENMDGSPNEESGMLGCWLIPLIVLIIIFALA